MRTNLNDTPAAELVALLRTCCAVTSASDPGVGGCSSKMHEPCSAVERLAENI
jgi:hypothetical protein